MIQRKPARGLKIDDLVNYGRDGLLAIAGTTTEPGQNEKYKADRLLHQYRHFYTTRSQQSNQHYHHQQPNLPYKQSQYQSSKMQFKTVLVSALSVLFAGQTMGAALTAIDAGEHATFRYSLL